MGIFVGGNSFTIAYNYINNYESLPDDSILRVRSVIIAAFLFCSFLNWATVIRCASHLGYLLGSSADDDNDEKIGETFIQRMESLTSNMTHNFATGFRLIFMAIPFALLGAGLLALVLSTFVMLGCLIELDSHAWQGRRSQVTMRHNSFSYEI